MRPTTALVREFLRHLAPLALVLVAALLASVTAVRTAHAAPETGRYVVEGDTVKDSRTKLLWTKTPPGTGYSWLSALNYCRTLRVGPPSTGITGWRLPTVKELQTLVDQGATPAIDAATFTTTPGLAFWSSTPNAATPTRNWGVDFATGRTVTGVSTVAWRVHCVK